MYNTIERLEIYHFYFWSLSQLQHSVLVNRKSKHNKMIGLYRIKSHMNTLPINGFLSKVWSFRYPKIR